MFAAPQEPPSSQSTVVGARAPWVLVLGTSQRALPSKLHVAAELVGASLARNHFNLATFGWAGVDELVARSFATAAGLPGEELEDRLVHFVGENAGPVFPGGWAMRFGTDADLISSALGYVDAVIVIGGARWTFDFASRAAEHEILVLPLAETSEGADFAARQLFETLAEAEFYTRLDFPEDVYSWLEAPVAEAVPAIIGLLNGYFSAKQTKTKPGRPAKSPPQRTTEVAALLNDGPRMARLLARSALAERSVLRWLQSPDPSQLLEASRVLGVNSVAGLLDMETRLNREFPDFQPNALWQAWFVRTQFPRLREAALTALPQAQREAASARPTPAPVPQPSENADSPAAAKSSEPSRSSRERMRKTPNAAPRPAVKKSASREKMK